MSEWVLRAYDPETDEGGVLALWIRSYEHSAYGIARGAHFRDGDGSLVAGQRSPKSETARRFWNEHRPFFLEVMKRATITVACDPERVHASELGPPIFWGFSVTEGETLHYCLVKRNFVKAGLGRDIASDLLGDMLAKPTPYTLEQVELRRMPGLMPRNWFCDHTFFQRARAA